MKNNDDWIWLFEWFHSQCDADWEHSKGIQIGTLDNPGWYLSVNLVGTECEGQVFESVSIERSESDWLTCFVQDEKFEGPCGPFNLSEVLKIFRQWVENCAEK